MKGCGRLFLNQELYAEHIRQRNMKRGCTPAPLPGPHPEVVLDDSNHEDAFMDISPPTSPPPLPASPPPPSFTGKVREDGIVEFLGTETLPPGVRQIPLEPASTSLKGAQSPKISKPGAYPSVQRDASPPPLPPPAYPSVQRSPSPETLLSSPSRGAPNRKHLPLIATGDPANYRTDMRKSKF